MMLSLAKNFVTVDGLKLAYYKSEQQYESTIVLLHGYCGSSSYFSKLVLHLEQFANVIVFDLFGHGQSDELQQEKYSLEEVASFIHIALQHIGGQDIYMFGHSLGGYITLAYANKFEQSLKGFGLLHSTAYPDSEAAKANRLTVIESVKVNGVATFVNQLAGKLFGDKPDEADVQLVKEIGLKTSVGGVVGFAHAMRERKDAQHIISYSQLPVLLVAGEQDKIVQPDAVFAGCAEQTICKRLPLAGHMGMLEADKEMAILLEQFLSSQRGSRA